MRDFNEHEKNRLRFVVESSFSDYGQRLVYGGVNNSFGEVESKFTPGDVVACGFSYITGSQEKINGKLIEVTYNATARIPKNTVIDIKDRFFVEGMTFDIVGIENRLTCKVLSLKYCEV